MFESIDNFFHAFPVVNFFYGIPDWDLKLRIPLIIWHRSIITHSCIIPLLIMCFLIPFLGKINIFLGKIGVHICRVIGFLFAVHFVCDLFPNSWQGTAFIYIPIVRNMQWIPWDGDLIPLIFSFLWLLFNSIICCFIAFLPTKDILDQFLQDTSSKHSDAEKQMSDVM